MPQPAPVAGLVPASSTQGGQQGGGLGDGDMPRGAARAGRVLGLKLGGLQARLFLKHLLRVIEGRRGFGGKLVCTGREGQR